MNAWSIFIAHLYLQVKSSWWSSIFELTDVKYTSNCYANIFSFSHLFLFDPIEAKNERIRGVLSFIRFYWKDWLELKAHTHTHRRTDRKSNNTPLVFASPYSNRFSSLSQSDSTSFTVNSSSHSRLFIDCVMHLSWVLLFFPFIVSLQERSLFTYSDNHCETRSEW